MFLFALPAIIAALIPPIDVLDTISIFIFLFVRALKTPHANAPNEPPSNVTFSILLKRHDNILRSFTSAMKISVIRILVSPFQHFVHVIVRSCRRL
jgi:hypothetical protein